MVLEIRNTPLVLCLLIWLQQENWALKRAKVFTFIHQVQRTWYPPVLENNIGRKQLYNYTIFMYHFLNHRCVNIKVANVSLCSHPVSSPVFFPCSRCVFVPRSRCVFVSRSVFLPSLPLCFSLSFTLCHEAAARTQEEYDLQLND